MINLMLLRRDIACLWHLYVLRCRKGMTEQTYCPGSGKVEHMRWCLGCGRSWSIFLNEKESS
jgi:hypothetical protein